MAFGGNRTSGPLDVSSALSALSAHGGSGRMDFESETFITHALTGEGFDASEDGTGRGTPLALVPFDTTQITSAANRSNPKPGDPCHPLAAGAHAPAIAFHGSQDPDVSGDVTHPVGRNQGQETCAQIGAAVRRLTPRECESLQGFPDDYTAIPLRNAKGKLNGKLAKDGPRYKALGNSWAVPCVSWIGRRIMAVDAIRCERIEAAA